MTHPSAEPGARLVRFGRAERAVHWSAAVLFAILVVTGAALHFATLMAIFGRRRLVEYTHLGAGLALPFPLLAGLASARYRADLGRLNRWSGADRRWLRLALRRGRLAAIEAGLPTGKFNAGQKLNAAFTAGAVLVLLGTGSIMYWWHPWPLAWRTGATDTHLWLALAVVIVITGHIRFAVADPDALRSMVRGWVPLRWARRHAPAWVEAEEP